MNRIFVVFVVIWQCFGCTPASAGEERPLTYREADALLGALLELDGPRKDVSSDGRVLKRDTYDLDVKTRLVIAVDRKRAEATGAIYAVGYNGLQARFAGKHLDGFKDRDELDGKVPPERLAAFQLEVSKGLDLVADNNFVPIAWEDLKPRANVYPPSVLAGLLPILKGLPEDMAELVKAPAPSPAKHD